ncbi:MAG: hypothetical protein Q4F29_03915 [Lachnospiraceae bacterium]|nr:hypothetical protein [Lachnospiraceae bacterium]
MTRDEFMDRLEYLLQDIPDEEKCDAVSYYRDYLEEAGPENEEAVIHDFGSPERVAAIIRADLAGAFEDGGEFTDKGYQDERFQDPNFGLAKRMDLPESAQEGPGGAGGNGTGNGAGAGWSSGAGNGSRAGAGPGGGYGRQKPHCEAGAAPKKGRWEWWQVVGMAVLTCCLVLAVFPVVFGIGSGIIGAVAGILISTTIALAAVTLALFVSGAAVIAFGIAHMTAAAEGILYLGTGIGLLGLGFLCLALCGLYYGKFLPWLFRTLIDLVSRLIHRKGASA